MTVHLNQSILKKKKLQFIYQQTDYFEIQEPFLFYKSQLRLIVC